MNMVRPAPHVAEGPQPLLRPIPPGEPYPAGALGPLREAVEAAQRQTQAPIAIAGQSALAMASLAVQAHADVATLAGTAPLSLFALTVARSGERKSTVDRLFMAGLREHEREAARAHRDDVASHADALAIWKCERERILADAKKGKGERQAAARADLDALGAEPRPPLAPNLTATEPTFEGLVKLYIAGQPALGLFSDEGAQFLGGHAMNADNRLKTIAGLSSLWDGAPINRTRGGDGTVTLLGRRLAAHLLVQPVAARPLLADPVAMGQGFLARFLIAEPVSAIGTRFVTDTTPEPAPALAAYASRLRAALAAERPTAPDDPQELRPRTLPFSAEARTHLVAFHNVVEAAQAPGGNLAHVTPFASKAAEQAARIAGVLTLWADLDAAEVTGPTMVDAIELAQFHLGEARRLAEAAVVSGPTERAEALRAWIVERWPERARHSGRPSSAQPPPPTSRTSSTPPRNVPPSSSMTGACPAPRPSGWRSRSSSAPRQPACCGRAGGWRHDRGRAGRRPPPSRAVADRARQTGGRGAPCRELLGVQATGGPEPTCSRPDAGGTARAGRPAG